MRWLPIETAPKDGTAVLLVVAGYNPAVGAFYEHGWDYQTSGDFAEESHWLTWIDQTGPRQPTHWMPLPAPPGSEPSPAADLPHNDDASEADTERADQYVKFGLREEDLP